MQEVICLFFDEPIRCGTSYISADVHRKLARVSGRIFLSLSPLPPEIKENTAELVLLSLQCAFYLVVWQARATSGRMGRIK